MYSPSDCKMKPKTNPAFSLAFDLQCDSVHEKYNRAHTDCNTLLGIRPSQLKSEQYKTLTVFPLKKINNKGLTQQRMRYRYTGRINNHCRKGCIFIFFLAHCVFSHKNHDVAFLRMVFYCYLCINFWHLQLDAWCNKPSLHSQVAKTEF